MTSVSEELGLNTSPKRLNTSVEFTTEGAQIVVVAELGESPNTLPIFDSLMEAMSKLKESLTKLPEAKWTISFDVGPMFEYECSSTKTTGQPADTESDTQTGAKEGE